jgi:hypothetical protein
VKRDIHVNDRKVANECIDEAVKLWPTWIETDSRDEATNNFRTIWRRLSNGPVVACFVFDKVPSEQLRVKRNSALRIRGGNIEVFGRCMKLN